jgi:hypothetical protein
MDRDYLKALEVQEITGLSRSQSYKLIAELNGRLVRNGEKIIPGRVRKSFFEDIYGLNIHFKNGVTR